MNRGLVDALRMRWRLLVWAAGTLPLTALSLVLFVCTVTGFGMLVVWAGIPLLLVTIPVTRWAARTRRRYAGALAGREIASPYLQTPTGNWLTRLRDYLLDPATRRDAYWVVVDGTLGLALSMIAIVEGVLDLVFWWLPPGLAVRAHARLDCALLDVSEKSRLALRVQQLTESRAETVDTQAAELRRIERDLHDGAQARLVALGMNLALAEQAIEQDPGAVRELLAEARHSSSAALAELRDLVRGIHPPVLADRGLVGAVQALALAASIPVDVQPTLERRLSAPVESAAYFVVAEALTNVIKHSGATQAWIEIDDDIAGQRLRLAVRDDGRGGADPGLGTGLQGIARRLAAFDGTMDIESPPTGGTRIVMVLPCASSSPKISPSSATA